MFPASPSVFKPFNDTQTSVPGLFTVSKQSLCCSRDHTFCDLLHKVCFVFLTYGQDEQDKAGHIPCRLSWSETAHESKQLQRKLWDCVQNVSSDIQYNLNKTSAESNHVDMSESTLTSVSSSSETSLLINTKMMLKYSSHPLFLDFIIESLWLLPTRFLLGSQFPRPIFNTCFNLGLMWGGCCRLCPNDEIIVVLI